MVGRFRRTTRDSEVAAAVVAGDPDGPAEAYDRYAAPLDAMPDVTDAAADAGGEIGRAELRALLRSAVRGLSAGDRDLIELQLRQGLDAAEIAAMLGVSRNHAHALLSGARDQLEASLGALVAARAGREDCAALSALLKAWDGQLTVPMRKRINRHIERCPECAERRRRELAQALLPGLAPLVALTASNGPVTWSITPSQGLIGGLTIAPSSGTLADDGASTTATISATDLLTAGGQLTVEPGGITVTVVLSVSL